MRNLKVHPPSVISENFSEQRVNYEKFIRDLKKNAKEIPDKFSNYIMGIKYK